MMDSKYAEACDLLEIDKIDEATKLFTEIIQEDDTHYMALNKLGVIHARKHEYEDAKVILDKALMINPDYAPTIVNIGNLELEKGENQAAMEYYKTALEKDENYHLALYNMAVAHKKMGNLDLYFKWLKKYKRSYREYIRGKNEEESLRHRNKALQITAVLVLFVVLFYILK